MYVNSDRNDSSNLASQQTQEKVVEIIVERYHKASAKRPLFFNQIPATAKIVSKEINLFKKLNVFSYFYEALVGEIITCLINSEK